TTTGTDELPTSCRAVSPDVSGIGRARQSGRLTLGALCPFNVRGDVRKIPRCEYDRRNRRRRTDGWSDRRRHWSRNHLSSWRTQRRRQDLTLAQFFLDVFQAQTTCLRSCSTDEHLDSAEGDRLGGNRPNRNASLGYGD